MPVAPSFVDTVPAVPAVRGRTVRGLTGTLSLLTALALAVATAAPAEAAVPDPRLATRLSAVLSDPRVQRADSGAVVLDGGSGAVLHGRRASRALVPASTTKLVTAAAAMDSLGPGYRFRTEVYRRASLTGGTVRGHLYLKGYGDPTTRQSDYRSLAEQVRAAGIRRFTGSLVADATYFDATRYNPGWSTGYADDYYAAETSGLTVAPNADLDAGTVIINHAPGRQGAKARVTTTPAAAAAHVRIDNRTTTGSSTSSSTVTVRRSHGSNTITVSGRVPRGRPTGHTLVTVHRPELYAAAVLRAELAKVGVSVAGRTVTRALPATGRHRLARDTSMPLADLLVPFLKLSNNAHAEALTKAMAAHARPGTAGSWPAGLAVTTSYLRRLGVPMAGVSLTDGSGLTRRNRLTALALATTLQKVRREPWSARFTAALPVAGNPARMVGGTLRARMRGTAAADNARAKTGSLTGVTALAGYVRGRDGRTYVYAMLSTYAGSSPRPVEDELVVTLAGWRR